MFLYNIVISPIEYIVDWVFSFIIVKFEAAGVIGAVLGVSLAINFLALPLYTVADSLRDKELALMKKLEPMTKRIKKTFRGDERFMMLQAYYKMNHYHPFYALRSSLSILIEVPFFIAAYHYLSHSELLRGAGFWIFRDLGAPDSLLRFGSFSLNVLPVLMTLINFVSGAVYLKGAPAREKIQLCAIALVFLFLLYNSPSGLVIYWILNNIFSLAKNIVMKMKNPGRILHRIISAMLVLLALVLAKKNDSFVKVSVFALFTLCVAFFPILLSRVVRPFLSKKEISVLPDDEKSVQKATLLALSGLSLALLSGLVIPASVISSSPVEFSFLGNTPSPVSYIISAFFVFSGFFVFWPLAVYKLFGKKVRMVLPPLFFVLLVISFLNVFVFKYDYGTMNISFQLDRTGVLRNYAPFFSIFPLAAFSAIFLFVLLLLLRKKSSILVSISSVLFVASLSFGLYKTVGISRAFKEYASSGYDGKKTQAEAVRPVISLSKTEKNVLIIFLDRAISSYFPKIIEQFPDIKKSFDGFVFFPNTVSFSTNTFPAFPSMLGGYEYTPERMGKDGRLLREQFAEGTLVLPRLFQDAGFGVTLCDMERPDSYSADIPLYGEISESSYISVNGTLNDFFFEKYNITGGLSASFADQVCRKQIVNFSVLQLLYPPLRLTFYNNMTKHAGEASFDEFYSNASTLEFLSELTDFSSEKGQFVFMLNDLTHAPIELDDAFSVPGKKSSSLEMKYYPDSKYDQIHFDVNVFAIMRISRWLDWLRENGVYDNTRIIVVSDHGRDVLAPCFSGDSLAEEKAYFNPLLLSKDFNSSGEVRTDSSFMTNADTLFLAKDGLALSDFNPFSKNELLSDKASGVDIYPCFGEEYNGNAMRTKNQFTLEKEKGFHVKENIFDSKNWERLK